MADFAFEYLQGERSLLSSIFPEEGVYEDYQIEEEPEIPAPPPHAEFYCLVPCCNLKVFDTVDAIDKHYLKIHRRHIHGCETCRNKFTTTAERDVHVSDYSH